MLKVTLRNLVTHKLRVALTFLAVALGVAFMGGTLVLTDTIGRNFDDLFEDVNAGTDTFVRGKERFEFDFGGFGARPSIAASLVKRVRAVDGVAAAEGGITRNGRIIGKDGDPIGTSGFGPPTFGSNWVTVDALNPFVLIEGSRAPKNGNELVIDKRSAEEGDFTVGDRVRVQSFAGTKTFRLVGIARFGTADSPGGATFAMTTLAEAQKRFLEPGRLDSIAVVAEEGVTERELADRIARELRDVRADVEVLTGAEITASDQSDIEQGTGFFSAFLLTFAVIALIVGSFVIYNSFSILVAQRTREMALLRAIGAGRGQVLRAVLVEAVIVGAVASVAGWFLGLGVATVLKAFFDAAGFDLPAGGTVIEPGSVFAAIFIGFVVTVVAAFVPAWRASRVPPLAAMRDVAVDRIGRVRLRFAFAVVVLVLGVLSLYGGIAGDGGLQATGLGAFLVFLATVLFGPLFARPSSRALGAPVAAAKGITGTLARENAARNPRRTAATASALIIGVGIIVFVLAASASITESFNDIIDERFNGDYVVSTGAFGFGGLPPELTTRLNEVQGVKGAAGIRGTGVEIDGSSEFASGIDPRVAFDLFDVGLIEGEPKDLEPVGTIAIHEQKAEDEGWAVGDVLDVVWPETGEQKLRIAGIYEHNDLAGDYIIGYPTIDANERDSSDAQVWIELEDDADPVATGAAIEKIVDGYPTGELLDLDEFKEQQASQFDPVLQLISVLLLLTIVIALLGIVNTLALSVLERTRELGLLRAVGATRRQVRSTIRWEAVIIALLGTAVGMALGLFFGWAIVKGLEDEGISTFLVPVPSMLFVLLLAVLFGMGAALYPAWRAGRLNVLEAIFDE